jgi:uroporphyrin-III C-methyltransferase/precorrin-2 dehydrogenase/sirohydrochlorin ferrochelatase
MTGERRSCGEVYLVGAGPGAADLLTLRALRLMREADVVVYDRLVGADILDLVPAGAERIFVGKMRDRHVLSQVEINRLLVRLARAGRRVLRLKGGDPFIFGRGGEELEALAAAGVPFQVVPGVTAALGCAAAAGIPLTHREHAQTLVFVTGHTKDAEVELNWPVLTQPAQTVVVYMGIKALPSLCRLLIAHGRAPGTPAAIIENGTYPHQQVVHGTLETLPALAIERRLDGPSLIVVGEVVGLHRQLIGHDGTSRPQDAIAEGDEI